MRGPVLPHPDRVVREDRHRRDLHQRRQADRHLRVFGEDEEPGAERAQLRQRHPVHDRAHRVLADPEMQVPAAGLLGREVAGALERQPGLRRGREVGRPAHEPRDARSERVQHLPGGLSSSEPLRVGREGGDVRVPALGQLAPLHAQQLVGQVGVRDSVGLERTEPLGACVGAPRPDAGTERLVDLLGHQEGRVLGPAVPTLGGADLLVAERFAVRGARVLLRRCAVGDMAVHDHEGRPRGLRAEGLEGTGERLGVVRVGDPHDVPAVGQEPCAHVLGEGQRGVALDRDVVVVVDPAQVR